MNLDEKEKEAVSQYCCSGCVSGPALECYEEWKDAPLNIGCTKHCPGTLVSHIGKIFLGMPKGFNRVGWQKEMRVNIFRNLDEQIRCWMYDKFNVPVWKWKKDGHIFVRGLMPRTNQGFVHVILDDTRFDEIDCYELTQDDLEGMD